MLRLLIALALIAAIAAMLFSIGARVEEPETPRAAPELKLMPLEPLKTPEPAAGEPIETPTAAKPVGAPAAPAPKAPATSAEAGAAVPSPALSFLELNTRARAALVNILCATAAGSPLQGESGSGFFVSERGVILTNAHIAQYYLLADYPNLGGVDCVIRTGSPAASLYRARLLYLSPRWVEANSDTITQESPSGTGEHDFALLLVTERTNKGASLPERFPFVPLADGEPPPESSLVLVAGYAAEFLSSAIIERELYAASAIAAVRKFFTFGSGSGDVFSVGSTILSTKGSSGGPVLSQDVAAAGVLVTSTTGATTGEREGFAITARHIRESFREETGASFSEFLASTDLSRAADAFAANTAPRLTALLTATLPH